MKASSTISSCRRPFVPEDLDAIDGRCATCSSRTCLRSGQNWSRDEAKQFFGDRGEPLKVPADRREDARSARGLLLHDQGPRHVRRLLRGPARAVDRPSSKAFKLLTTSNAYWKGDARNQPMQRVYGTAFLSEKELQQHLTRLEEAKKRDHRKIGRTRAVHVPPVGAGRRPSGSPTAPTLYNTLANYMRGLLFPAGYVEVKRRSSSTRRSGRPPATGSTTGRTCSSSRARR
jgi:threonyl-tRNA synthetase